MNEVNELFTKENVEKIYVPDIVKDDLLSIIEEKLKKAGFYYRVAYRVKAPDSMLDKLILKDSLYFLRHVLFLQPENSMHIQHFLLRPPHLRE